MALKIGDRLRSIFYVTVPPFLQWFWPFTSSKMTQKGHGSKVFWSTKRMSGRREKLVHLLRNGSNSGEWTVKICYSQLKSNYCTALSWLNGLWNNLSFLIFFSSPPHRLELYSMSSGVSEQTDLRNMQANEHIRSHRTVGWNDLKLTHSFHRRNPFSICSGASEWAQRSARAKQAARSKQIS